jgi:type II secretory pathway component PulJ
MDTLVALAVVAITILTSVSVGAFAMAASMSRKTA